MPGLTFPAAVARGRHWKPISHHAECDAQEIQQTHSFKNSVNFTSEISDASYLEQTVKEDDASLSPKLSKVLNSLC